MTDLHGAGARAARGAGLAHATLALGGFAIGTAEFASMSFLPSFSAGLGVDAPTGGHVISAYALGVVGGAPLLAVLGARFDRRTLLVLLMAWFAVGNGLSAVAPDFTSLVLFRFLTGLPHGAYFGIAALVAAGMVPPARRAAAIGRVMTGLTVATIVGVPLASLVAQRLGWRVGFAGVGGIAVLTALLVSRVVPRQGVDRLASPLRELGALRNGQVWLSLGIGAIGFGGMFAVYTYLASTLALVTRAPEQALPMVLAVFGVGLTLGNGLAPRLVRWGVMTAAGLLLAWSAAALAIYPFTVGNVWLIGLAVFAIACGGGLGTVLQTHLMDVAGEAQSLAAALNHSAFNVANALGPWLGGLAIAAGHGWASVGWVGSGLALAGLAIWAMAVGAGRQAVRA